MQNVIPKIKNKKKTQLVPHIIAIQREEQKTIAMIKDAAKKNQMDVCKISAKSLVQSKKQKARIYASQAQINSIVMQMKNQLGTRVHLFLRSPHSFIF